MSESEVKPPTELMSEILGCNDGEVFHRKLLEFSDIVSRWPQNERVPPDHILEFKNRTFDFSINLGSDVKPSIFVHFEDCTFKAEFHLNRFKRVYSRNCTFEKLFLTSQPIFEHTISGGTIKHLVANSYHSGWSKIRDVTIEDFKIHESMEAILFADVTFNNIKSMQWSSDKIVLKDIRFTRSKFKGFPDFLDCELKKDVEFTDCIFKADSFYAAVYYRDLKHKMLDNKNDIAAAFFSGMELRASHGDITSLREKFFSRCYRIMSNYGLAPYRPMIYLVLLFGAAFFYFDTMIDIDGPFAGKEKAQLLFPQDQVWYLAIISCLGPLRVLGTFDLIIINTAWPQLMMWFFTALSSLLWFFLILAIRRRFKVD